MAMHDYAEVVRKGDARAKGDGFVVMHKPGKKDEGMAEMPMMPHRQTLRLPVKDFKSLIRAKVSSKMEITCKVQVTCMDEHNVTIGVDAIRIEE